MSINWLRKNNFILIVSLIVGGLFLLGNSVLASDNHRLKIFSTKLLKVHDFEVMNDEFTGALAVETLDLGGDGQDEILLAYGEISQPYLKIFRYDGTEINTWQPYPQGFTGEISVAAGDLDNDGKDEIITGAGAGGGPQVRIFNGFGETKFHKGFFAGDKDYRKGIKVAVGNVDNDLAKEIIVSLINEDQAEIKIFQRDGALKYPSFKFDIDSGFEAPFVKTLDLGNDGVEEVLVALGSGNSPLIKVFRKDGSLINEYHAYHPAFGGGVNFSPFNYNGQKLIATGSGFSGGPHVRFLDNTGQAKIETHFFPYESKLRKGLVIAAGDVNGDGQDEILTVPKYNNEDASFVKYIDIDLSEQILRYYQNGRMLGEHLISSGLPSMKTPVGEYTIWQKNPRAYSRQYDLYMPWWMSFKPSYGIHELPEWANGYKEGEDHLGRVASHGCVRLGVGPAETVYKWANLGTKVLIHE